MVSGQSKGSRFGSKGEENLGNGLKVGFVLENGYAADSGDFSQGGRLFGRDARLYLDGNFGYLSFGHGSDCRRQRLVRPLRSRGGPVLLRLG